jgi:signal transduction histidine kinase
MFLSALRSGLSQFLPGVVDCRVYRSESRDGTTVCREVGSGGPEHPARELPGPFRAALESNRPVFLKGSLRPAEHWHGGEAARVRSTAVIPVSGGFLLAAGRMRSTFKRHRRRAVTELAQIISAALRRLDDLRTLSVRETQLRQARSMEALGTLTAGIAHRFNNFMQTILGSIELARQVGASRSEPYLMEIDDAGRKASGLVRRLLLFSKRAPRLDDRDVDLGPIVERAATRAGIPVVRDVRVAARVRGDAKQLEEIIGQLLANARDAVSGRKSPEIRLILDRADPTQTGGSRTGGDFVCMEVFDNGTGIDPNLWDRVFDPFFTTRMADREGLGLSMVLYFTGRHGGWVDLDSSPDGGTTVRVFLPTVPHSTPRKADAAGRVSVACG